MTFHRYDLVANKREIICNTELMFITFAGKSVVIDSANDCEANKNNSRICHVQKETGECTSLPF